MVKAASWLSITPEPERELPAAVATLTCGGPPSAQQVAAESARLERLVLHGTQRQWLRYLHAVVELIDRSADDATPEVRSARSRAVAVISNHHNLLLGLPGRGAQLSAADRRRLTELDLENHEVKGQT
ncbi:MAG TPA: hypothetical protein VKR21_12595 [Solirubrobacteraceae bacterium]|nr:hypothetical protein [Solirubrobacteraceae bacterium]